MVILDPHRWPKEQYLLNELEHQIETLHPHTTSIILFQTIQYAIFELDTLMLQQISLFLLGKMVLCRDPSSILLFLALSEARYGIWLLRGHQA